MKLKDFKQVFGIEFCVDLSDRTQLSDILKSQLGKNYYALKGEAGLYLIMGYCRATGKQPFCRVSASDFKRLAESYGEILKEIKVAFIVEEAPDDFKPNGVNCLEVNLQSAEDQICKSFGELTGKGSVAVVIKSGAYEFVHSYSSDNAENVIVTKNLCKKYGEFYANNNVSLTVKKGSIYGLIGRNGAGKTTFMKMLLGLSRKTSGEIEMLGESGLGLNRARKKVGFIVETPAFHNNMTATQNLRYIAKIKGVKNEKEKVRLALERVGITKLADHKAKNMSLGERQKLALATCLLDDPELLILDEPVNGLDPIAIVEIRELLQSFVAQEGMTILISSHILGELEKLATCYGFILNGKLVREISERENAEHHVDLENLFLELAEGESV